MGATVLERTTVGTDTWVPVAHIGVDGDRTGLCGAPTLGIPAFGRAESCAECWAVWDAMTWRQRHRYKGQS